MKPSILLHDLRRLAGSARRHLHERRHPHRADLGLAWLQADGADELHPHLRRYSAAWTDLGSVSRRVLLTLEQWQAPADGSGGRRANYMALEMDSRPCARRTLVWVTDGHSFARAFSDRDEIKVRFDPGEAPLHGRCAAILGLWLDGNQVDQVTVYETFGQDAR